MAPTSLPALWVRFQRPWQRTLSFVLAAASMPVVGALTIMGHGQLRLWPMAITALFFCAAVAADHRDRRRRGGSVTLTAAGIDVLVPGRAKPLTIDRSEVEAAFEAPRERAVELHLTGGRRLVVESPEPSALLAHLGHATTQRAVTMPLRATLRAVLLGLSTTVVSWTAFTLAAIALIPLSRGNEMATLAEMGLPIVATIFSVWFMVWRFGHPRVVVGADGVRVRGMFTAPFVPYGDILNVTPLRRGVQLTLRNGKSMRLETHEESVVQLSALGARIHEGRVACAAQSAGPTSVLERAGRSLEAWQEDIRRVALAPPGFRDPAYSPDDFERIVADASAPPDHRVGAALALRIADPAARPRIRIAAAATANNDLRDALEACADEGEELEEAPLQRATLRAR